jgi:DNA repair exonuclease SbcCD nuclease subunit
MKILITSDIHIHDLQTYSTLDERGVPSRLNDYIQLSKDLVQISLENKVEAVFLAGDLVHSSSPRPMVLNTVREFLETLGSIGIPIFIIVGQHDMDTKGDNNDRVNSVVTSLVEGLDHIHYVVDEAVIPLGKMKVYCRSWKSGEVDIQSFPKADIFLGHGLVIDAKDVHGHIFGSGFSVPQLQEKYRLSIIGDIHEPHEYGEKNKVLIPGQPIQSNFTSGTPGVWIANIPSTGSVKLQHLKQDTDYPNPNRYHRFEINSTGEGNGGSHFHYRKRLTKRQKVSKSTPEAREYSSGLWDMILEALTEAKLEEILPVVSECFSNVSLKEQRSIPESRFLKINISNFMSIEKLDIDLREFSGSLLIDSPNGQGKTTVCEAFYWLLTGDTTKEGKEANSVNRWGSKESARVTGELSLGDQIYRISRSRKDPLLTLSVLSEGEEWISLTKGSSKDTQRSIYDLIGVDSKNILTMIYFSLNQLNAFSGMQDSEKQEFMGRVSGIETLFALQESVQSEISARKEELSPLRSDIISTSKEIESAKEKRIMLEREVEDSGIPDLNELRGNLDLAESSLVNEEEYDSAISRRDTLETKIEQYENYISMAAENWKSEKKKLVELKSGKCPECGQEYLNQEAIAKSESRLSEYTEKMREGKSVVGSLKKEKESVELAISLLQKGIDANSELRFKIKEIRTELKRWEGKQDHSGTIRFLLEREKELLSKLETNKLEEERLSLVMQQLTTARNRTLSKGSDLAKRISSEAMRTLEREINSIVGDSDLYEIKIEEDMSISARFNGGPNTPSGSMSGGERRLTDILLLIATNNVFSSHFGISEGILGIVFFDEVFSYLDDQNTEIAMRAMENLGARIKVVISHDPRVKDSVDNILSVKKDEKGISHFFITNCEGLFLSE